MSSTKIREMLAAARAKKKAETTPFDKDAYLKAKRAKFMEEESPAPTPPPSIGEKPKGGIDFKARLAALHKKSTDMDVAGTETGRFPAKKDTVTDIEPEAQLVAPEPLTHIGIDGSTITYNQEQEEFVKLLSSGESCVLIGSAGTGKTTCTQGAIAALIQTGAVPPLKSDGHKHLQDGAPGVVTISYTRRAVNNIRKVLPEDLKGNCITAHKLLEYAPEYYEIFDEALGQMKKTMAFVPTRNANNPLPSTIHTIIVEESSMVDLTLYSQIVAALQHPVQWVFIGDIQQLPPVFGSAILGYKMLELTVIELTEVYRQALESPIIRLAQRILSGKPIPALEYDEWKVSEQLTIHPWKKKLHPDIAVATLGAFFTAAYDAGSYDISEDMILIPYNKSCGTLELNRYIANHIARAKGETTYEVMAGFNKHYFSVGDRVLYDKEDAEIIEITHNPSYLGSRVQPESKTLDYWGFNPNLASESFHTAEDADAEIDFILSQVDSQKEDRVTQSSHKITVKLLDTGTHLTVVKAADVNNLLHAYALTVHKAQGSEWRKVFLCLHQSHATMLQRELLYTAITRAREELYVICEPESFTKGIKSQKIKGNTLKEKAEYFKGKVDKNDEALMQAVSNAPSRR